MAKHFYSYQFDMPYRSTYLRNWEVPKYYCPKPRKQVGTTKIISNSRGHLLPGVPRPPTNPFDVYIGTWQLPKKITREIANELNGTAGKQAFLEKCRAAVAAAALHSKLQKDFGEEKLLKKEEEKVPEVELERVEIAEEEEDVEKTKELEVKESEIQKVICPIHYILVK